MSVPDLLRAAACRARETAVTTTANVGEAIADLLDQAAAAHDANGGLGGDVLTPLARAIIGAPALRTVDDAGLVTLWPGCRWHPADGILGTGGHADEGPVGAICVYCGASVAGQRPVKVEVLELVRTLKPGEDRQDLCYLCDQCSSLPGPAAATGEVPQILVDADNLPVVLLRGLAAELGRLPEARIVVVGRRGRPETADWPAGTEIVTANGWQHADFALAELYQASEAPLVLVSGDGDFVGLVQRHAGPVLVVSQQPSGRYRDIAPVVNPAVEGWAAVVAWLASVDGLW